MLLWLWHTATVYFATAWPLCARGFNKSKMQMGCYHFISCIVIAALSAVPVVIVMLVSSMPSGKGGFIITHAPPILCTGFDIHTNFWAFVFPTSLVLAAGVTFEVFTLRVVIKVVYAVIRWYYCHSVPVTFSESLHSQSWNKYGMECGTESVHCAGLLFYFWDSDPLHLHQLSS